MFFVYICLTCVAIAGGFAMNEPINENKHKIIVAHNRYRNELQINGLIWDDNLATHAQAWAQTLANSNTFEHSPANQREGEGENLFEGTAGHYSLNDMVNAWGDETKFFKYGIFPDITIPGIDWDAVSHYTQIIWRDTLRVGCGGEKGEDDCINY
jgi:hypothetical protein